jgi:hypothetical protein
MVSSPTSTWPMTRVVHYDDTRSYDRCAGLPRARGWLGVVDAGTPSPRLEQVAAPASVPWLNIGRLRASSSDTQRHHHRVKTPRPMALTIDDIHAAGAPDRVVLSSMAWPEEARCHAPASARRGQRETRGSTGPVIRPGPGIASFRCRNGQVDSDRHLRFIAHAHRAGLPSGSTVDTARYSLPGGG